MTEEQKRLLSEYKWPLAAIISGINTHNNDEIAVCLNSLIEDIIAAKDAEKEEALREERERIMDIKKIMSIIYNFEGCGEYGCEGLCSEKCKPMLRKLIINCS